MISINSLVFKNHILKYGIVLEQFKREDGGVYCELIQTLEKTKSLVKVYLDFSGDDKEVRIGVLHYIFVGGLNKIAEVEDKLKEINKNERLYKFKIKDNFISLEGNLNFNDDFTINTIDYAIIELLQTLDNNYRSFMKILY